MIAVNFYYELEKQIVLNKTKGIVIFAVKIP